MITGSKELIRDINRNLLLENIINEVSISRARLSQITGLTKATVSAIVAELIEQEFVLEIGSDNTALGRKPILLTFNPTCGHVISVDLNINTISVLISDLRGEHCSLTLHEHHVNRNGILSQLVDILRHTLTTIPHSKHGIIGICIGIHGTVLDNDILFSPYAPYEGLPFQSYLEEALHIPVYLENEANLSVIGEKTFCYNVPNLIGISVHSGIGVGIIINQDLYKGHNGNAGEFGHTIVERGGRLCPCGNRGCLEQYASERVLLQQFRDYYDLSSISLDDFIDAYTKNDTCAHSLIDDFISYMAIGINNLLATFNPNLIVINSTFIIHLPKLLNKLENRLQSRLSSNCTLVPSGLQDTSILLGGVCICTKKFLGIEHFSFEKK